MKILYFNYSDRNLATMLRCFELARAASLGGNSVTLCFMNRAFSPPAFFAEMLETYRSENLSFEFKSTLVREQPLPQASSTSRPRKNTLLGLLKRTLLSFRHVLSELELIRKHSPDVVVARPDLVFSFLLSTFFTKRPLVLSTDGPVEELAFYWGITTNWLSVIDYFRLKKADAILYISDVCGQLLVNKGIAKEKLFCCPNGADPDFFKPLPPPERDALRKRFGLEHSKVIGFSGNQVGYHGVGELLKSCRPLLQQDPALKLLIIGTIKHPQALALSDVPEDLVTAQVVFTGMVPYAEMPAYIDCSDLMVMPYPPLDLFHFSPMKMFEALSMSKIIVAPAQGQIVDILSGLPCAFLYDPLRPDSLGASVRLALEAIATGLEGSAGRALLLAKHTWIIRGQTLSNACRYAMDKKHALKD